MKNFIFLSLSVILLAFSSCRTTIPTRDTRAPKFNFRIDGDGFSADINQDFDFDNSALYLSRNGVFNAVYSGSDNGGLKEFSITMPNSIYLIHNAPSPSVRANSGNPETEKSSFLLFYDDENPPRTGAVMTINRMQAIGDSMTGTIRNFEFEFLVKDTHDNVTLRKLVVRITNQSTAIRPID